MSLSEKENLHNRVELRERIINTAYMLFMSNGIKCIKMDDIASALGISKRTLYEVFDDKEMLLCECVKKKHYEMDIFFEEVLHNSKHVLEVILMGYQRSVENFHETHKNFFLDIMKYPKACDLVLKRRERDASYTVSFMQKGVEQGIFREDINFNIINHLLREQLNLLMNTDLCKKYPFLDVYETIIVTMLRGVSTAKGADVLDNFIKDYRKKREQNETDIK